MATYMCQWDDTNSTGLQWAYLTGMLGQPVSFAMKRLVKSAALSALSDPIYYV